MTHTLGLHLILPTQAAVSRAPRAGRPGTGLPALWDPPARRSRPSLGNWTSGPRRAPLASAARAASGPQAPGAAAGRPARRRAGLRAEEAGPAAPGPGPTQRAPRLSTQTAPGTQEVRRRNWVRPWRARRLRSHRSAPLPASAERPPPQPQPSSAAERRFSSRPQAPPSSGPRPSPGPALLQVPPATASGPPLATPIAKAPPIPWRPRLASPGLPPLPPPLHLGGWQLLLKLRSHNKSSSLTQDSEFL